MFVRSGLMAGLLLGWVVAGEAPAQMVARRALLVSVSNYDHAEMNRTRLKYPESDARAFGDMLAKHGYDVAHLSGRLASKRVVEAQLQALANSSNSDSVLLVGLWGHGVQFDGDDNAYFCPVDTRVQVVRDARGNPVPDDQGKPFLEPDRRSLIKLSTVLEALKTSGAGNNILLADCCRNSQTRARSVGFGSKLRVDDLPPNSLAMLACGPSQEAFESDVWKGGAFTRGLLNELPRLASEGVTGAASLIDPVRTSVAQLVKDATRGRRRQDVQSLLAGGPDLKLIAPPGAKPPKDSPKSRKSGDNAQLIPPSGRARSGEMSKVVGRGAAPQLDFGDIAVCTIKRCASTGNGFVCDVVLKGKRNVEMGVAMAQCVAQDDEGNVYQCSQIRLGNKTANVNNRGALAGALVTTISHQIYEDAPLKAAFQFRGEKRPKKLSVLTLGVNSFKPNPTIGFGGSPVVKYTFRDVPLSR